MTNIITAILWNNNKVHLVYSNSSLYLGNYEHLLSGCRYKAPKRFTSIFITSNVYIN